MPVGKNLLNTKLRVRLRVESSGKVADKSHKARVSMRKLIIIKIIN